MHLLRFQQPSYHAFTEQEGEFIPLAAPCVASPPDPAE